MDKMNEVPVSSLVVQAKNIAKFHGIDVHHEVSSPPDGHCALHSVMNQINGRECFDEKHSYDSIKEVRKKVFDELKNSVLEFCGTCGLSSYEFEKEWKMLRESNIYEHPIFDLILPMP